MNAIARIKLNIFPVNRFETVFNALKPEISCSSTFRSEVDIEKDGTFLTLKVKAKDTVALRAAINSYLRWISGILAVYSVLKSPTCEEPTFQLV